jgi:hypothetical protein
LVSNIDSLKVKLREIDPQKSHRYKIWYDNWDFMNNSQNEEDDDE